MKPITLVIPYRPDPFWTEFVSSCISSGYVEEVIWVVEGSQRPPRGTVFFEGHLQKSTTLGALLARVRTDYVILLTEARQVTITPAQIGKLLAVGEATKAGLVYADFYESREETIHTLNDYQLGSVRDDFDFGPLLFFSVAALRDCRRRYDLPSGVDFSGLYDLRLKLSLHYPLYHAAEPLYRVISSEGEGRGYEEGLFSYCDPRNRSVQRERELVFTEHLKRLGAYLPPVFKDVSEAGNYPVEASVIIPVRNRVKTIAEAVRSALSQQTDFSFNVIVVDNHSTDGTTALLSELAGRFPTLIHLVPGRTDLGIGGCWNVGIHSPLCGRYGVQLDSDDLYSDTHTLQKMVDVFRQGNYAMVIGSYTLVDFDLNEIPPGLIDHREWTSENGRNNALRVNGLGAPRAFCTGIMRQIGFLNVSYGEDYAAALRICREFRIGRIYDSIYLCRRWTGNTDHGLSLAAINRNNAFKDSLRTAEIVARQKMVGEEAGEARRRQEG